MKVSGNNVEYQLGEDSNCKDVFGYRCNSPYRDSNLNISSLSCISFYGYHSCWITKDGRGFAIGSNGKLEILATLDRDTIDKEQEFSLFDDKNRKCNLISLLCGSLYTLYLVSVEGEKNNQLALQYDDREKLTFLNTNNHNPVYLFGGKEEAAAIDTEGNIILIKPDYKNIKDKVIIAALPNGEKPVSIAVPGIYIYVADSNGGVFKANMDDMVFSKVEELEGEEVIEVSGTFYDCLAVCKSGRVYEGSRFLKFKKISSLEKYKIVSASDSGSHSLFITEEGKVLARGRNNNYGQLILASGPSEDEYEIPVETSITSGAKFCIAGDCISVVFVSEPPENTPNRRINQNRRHTIMKSDKPVEKLEEKNVSHLKRLQAIITPKKGIQIP